MGEPEYQAQPNQSPSAQTLLESAADRLPTSDGIALAIMEAWENDSSTVEQLAKLVQADPSLSGRVLKLANSAASGRRPVASLPEAIVRVGMQTVGQLAVAFSMIGKDVIANCPAFDSQQYWARCLFTAVLARGLGQATRVAPPDDMFACGLLCRIGVLGLVSIYPEAYSDVLSARPSDLAELERKTFGVDHNELSEAMMLDFFVPKVLAEPARFHEDPKQSGFPEDSRPLKITQVLHLAYVLSEPAAGNSDQISAEKSTIRACADQLGLEESRVAAIFDAGQAEWQDWCDLLQMSTGEVASFDEISCCENDSAGESTAESERLTPVAAIVGSTEVFATLSPKLEQIEVPVVHCQKGSEAVQLAINDEANVFFVAQEHQRFIEIIRSGEAGESNYVFLLLDSQDPEARTEAYVVGADSVIPTDISPAEALCARLNPVRRLLKRQERKQGDQRQLRQIAKELALAHRKQEMLALTDQLTDLPNRRAAIHSLEQCWSRSLRSDAPCTALILDIDHFKRINDTLGHDAGDLVLQSLASLLKQTVRKGETVARMGGEEFLLISNEMPMREAVVAAERLRRQIESAEIKAGGRLVPMRASIGISVRDDSMDAYTDLLKAADRALYKAKDAGRNCVALYSGGNIKVFKS